MRISEVVSRDEVVDEGPASKKLCTSAKPDGALGSSNLSSCRSQGLRPRQSGKSYRIGGKVTKVRGLKVKGTKYGGPIPDYSGH